MANYEQLNILLQGIKTWNQWITENSTTFIDLIEADLSDVDLSEAKLAGAKLNRARLSRTSFRQADLSGTDLSEADLSAADLSDADLSKAKLAGAKLNRARLSRTSLRQADLSGTDLSESYLREADLSKASLIETNLEGAFIEGCKIYGISAWGLKLTNSLQKDLIITPSQPIITVDDLEIAQLVYLLLHNEKIRGVIDTIARKAVLILGRFTPERKAVLDALLKELRNRGYLPVLFDFEKPKSLDMPETIASLAHMARFIIADITDARSIQEILARIVPEISVPVIPLILNSDIEYAMFEQIRRYSWVLEPIRYENQDDLIASLDEKIIAAAEDKAIELEKLKADISKSSSYFISYYWKDVEFANQLKSDLEKAGVQCELIGRDDEVGESWVDQITKTIQAQDKLLLVLSETSLKLVIQEISKAFVKKGIMLPASFFLIFLLPMEFAGLFLTEFSISYKETLLGTSFDFSNWRDKKQYQKAFSKLVREIALRASAESRRHD
jgi:hypothetical protein